MTATDTQPWLNVEALRKLAGDKVLAEAHRYHHDDKVTLFAVTPDRIIAHVEGSEDHRVWLHREGETIEGECSCADTAQSRPCRHAVAAVLAANAVGLSHSNSLPGILDRIQFSFIGASLSALIRAIRAPAEHPPRRFHPIDSVADMDPDQRALIEQMRQAVRCAAEREDEYLGRQRVREWAARLDTALGEVKALSDNGQAAPNRSRPRALSARGKLGRTFSPRGSSLRRSAGRRRAGRIPSLGDGEVGTFPVHTTPQHFGNQRDPRP
jgi:hypothetical protein